MTPDERYDTLLKEVYEAARNQAPHGWLMDYVEYCGETPSTLPVPTFANYLEFQVEQERELGDETRTPEYLPELLEYLSKHGPRTELEELEQCGYCHTFGHETADCPDMPMQRVTVNVLVPGSYNNPSSFIEGTLKRALPGDIEVEDVFLEVD